MNQQTLNSIWSWLITIVVIGFGLWLGAKFGSAVMWTVLVLILALTVILHVWMSSRMARSSLELQQRYVQLTRGKTIHALVTEDPDFLPTLLKYPQQSIKAILEVLDESQTRDLQEALSGDGPRVPAD